jgi:hypothetical protein
MTGVVAVACFGMGFVVAWVVWATFKSAQLSWWQERMQRKVRYWQGETIHARAVAEQLISQLAASTGRELGPPDWPQASAGGEE